MNIKVFTRPIQIKELAAIINKYKASGHNVYIIVNSMDHPEIPIITAFVK